MTKRLRGTSMKDLKGETITDVHYGSELTPKCGSYGAMTLQTQSGKELVIWTSMGEVNLSIVEEV